jgi:hypothetical protein
MQCVPRVDSPDEEQRWKAVRVCIAKGDKARRKAENFYIAASQHLKALKDAHDARGGTWVEWEALVKQRAGIGKSRASELLQIADGTRTASEVAAATTERSKKHRALSPLRNGENAPDPEVAAEAKKTAPTKRSPRKSSVNWRQRTLTSMSLRPRASTTRT